VAEHLLAGLRPPSVEVNRRVVGARVSVARGVSEAVGQVALGAEWLGPLGGRQAARPRGRGASKEAGGASGGPDPGRGGVATDHGRRPGDARACPRRADWPRGRGRPPA
jgi:hypothetical protein